VGDPEDSLSRRWMNDLGESDHATHARAWFGPARSCRSELIGIEADVRARSTSARKLVEFLSREASEFLTVERPYHRFVPVASVPLGFAGLVDLGCAEVKLTDHR
jgi:hypothetical protein